MDILEEPNQDEIQYTDDQLWVIEKLITSQKGKTVKYKGEQATIVGFTKGKVLLVQGEKRLMTHPDNVGLSI